jgi:hypothetical protein
MTVEGARENSVVKFQHLPYVKLGNEALTSFSARCEVKYQRKSIFNYLRKGLVITK